MQASCHVMSCHDRHGPKTSLAPRTVADDDDDDDDNNNKPVLRQPTKNSLIFPSLPFTCPSSSSAEPRRTASRDGPLHSAAALLRHADITAPGRDSVS
jgi:hypothetical protein